MMVILRVIRVGRILKKSSGHKNTRPVPGSTVGLIMLSVWLCNDVLLPFAICHLPFAIGIAFAALLSLAVLLAAWWYLAGRYGVNGSM